MIRLSGDKNLIINQQSYGGQWTEMGSFHFEDGYQKALTIHGEEDKYIIADAVKFEFIDE